MKIKDVPQDNSQHYENQLRAVYAQDRDGRVVVTTTNGWEVEEMMTAQAVDEFDQLTQQAYARARAGETAALEGHMYARRMDIPTLSQATGIWQWRVKRHLRPEIFAKLGPGLISKYCEALGMTSEALRVPEAPVEH